MYIGKNIADIRKEPDPKSERVSQALFNTKCELISQKEDWALTEMSGGFKGWIRKNYLKENIYNENSQWRVKELFTPVHCQETRNLYTKLGFNTKFFGEPCGDFVLTEWSWDQMVEIKKDHLEPIEAEKDFQLIGKVAQRFMGTPYLWGGISPFGLDCSGFVQTLFDYFGKDLPRNSEDQEKVGEVVTKSSRKEALREEPNLGDTLFFPGHVGIYLENGRMIHSCSHENGVAITDLTDDSDYSQEPRPKGGAYKETMER